MRLAGRGVGAPKSGARAVALVACGLFHEPFNIDACLSRRPCLLTLVVEGPRNPGRDVQAEVLEYSADILASEPHTFAPSDFPVGREGGLGDGYVEGTKAVHDARPVDAKLPQQAAGCAQGVPQQREKNVLRSYGSITKDSRETLSSAVHEIRGWRESDADGVVGSRVARVSHPREQLRRVNVFLLKCSTSRRVAWQLTHGKQEEVVACDITAQLSSVSRNPGHEFSRQLRTLSPEPGPSHHANPKLGPPHGARRGTLAVEGCAPLPDTELVLLSPALLSSAPQGSFRAAMAYGSSADASESVMSQWSSGPLHERRQKVHHGLSPARPKTLKVKCEASRE